LRSGEGFPLVLVASHKHPKESLRPLKSLTALLSRRLPIFPQTLQKLDQLCQRGKTLRLAGLNIFQARPPVPSIVVHSPHAQQVGAVLVSHHGLSPQIAVSMRIRCSCVLFVANKYQESLRKPGKKSHSREIFYFLILAILQYLIQVVVTRTLATPGTGDKSPGRAQRRVNPA
jgi:hypothetical protein